ncbi:MAG: SMC-Scp complex subunit ScpB [Tepidisphaeraceae bacterium]
MIMRLVKDDDTTDAADMQTDQESEQDQQPAPRRRHRRGNEAPAEQTAPATNVEESADGPVEADPEPVGASTDKTESSADESSDQSGPSIDLALMEALLFSTHHPLTAGRIAELMDLPGTKPVRKAIQSLNEQYESTARCFRVEQVAGGYQLLTLPVHGDALKKLHQKEADAKLTKAALETLAIIAYKQPILRADVEAIRGVACGETIRSLMEKHLVKIAGRAEEPGRPILYGTTKRFLELFGLNTLKDLPQGEDQQLMPKPQAAPVHL